MAGTPHPPSDRTPNAAEGRRRLSRISRLSRYDILLAVVPAAFLVGLVASGLTDVPLRVAMSSAAAVGALALVDGLFLNPPRGPRSRDREGPA